MKRFHSNIGSTKRSLKERPEIFHSVDVNLSAHISLSLVHDVMHETALQSVVIGHSVIGIDRAAKLHIAENRILQSFAGHIRNNLSANLTKVPVKNAVDNRLVLVRSSAFGLNALSLVHVLDAATHKGFVSLNCATFTADLGCVAELTPLHDFADALQHKPCRRLSNSNRLCEFITADAVFAVRQKPECDHPLIKSDRRIFHDRLDLDGELLLAGVAEPEPARLNKRVLCRSTSRAKNVAIRPAQFLCKLKSAIRIGKIRNRFLQGFRLGKYVLAFHDQNPTLSAHVCQLVYCRYANLGAAYLCLNRLDDARVTFDQALARRLDSGWLRENIYSLAFLRADANEMQQQVAWSAGKPGDEDPLLSKQSDTEAYYGRLKKARDLSRRAVDSAIRADSKEVAAFWQLNAALREAELGNTASARRGVTAALALAPGRDAKVVEALTLARIGDVSRAKALAEELEKSYPTNRFLKLYWLPTINASIEISKGNSSQALLDLEAAAPYELGGAATFISYLYPAYVRGQAFLLAHNGNDATTEFQKVLDHRGIVVNFVTGSLAHLQIGRAYAMAGDTARAKAAYHDFLTLWKEGDPDIPILKQAKAEYAKLQ